MPITVTKLVITPIEKQRIAIEKHIRKWETKLDELQKKCKHKNASKINKGYVGDILNGTDDAYWRECKCPECDLRWNEPQR